MKNKILLKILSMSVFSLSVMLSSCETAQVTSVSASADNNLALVKGLPGWNPLSVIAVKVYSIDGKKVDSGKNSYQLSAGKHVIKVRCSRENPEPIQRYLKFELYLKAGHIYKPRLDMTKDCQLDYIDVNSGKTYAGVED